ncbi:MAG: aminotransferase class V-fold PLP-dependent enzyme [Candidatus Odinarchaeia archaeon]
MKNNDKSLTVEEVRQDIPLTEKYIYLDSGATTPVPKPVIEKMNEYLLEYGANIERGAYSIAHRATEEWDNARKDIATLLLNCKPEELIFARNLTQGANIVAFSLANKKIKYTHRSLIEEPPIIKWGKNSEIITTIVEHHSNILPWMRLAHQVKAKFKIIKNLPKTGEITVGNIMENITENTKLIALQHCSNVFGTINNVEKITKSIKKEYPDCLVYIDGSQGPGHMPVDVKKIKCDFYGFSGHKGPLGPPGTGGLYVRREIIERMEPIEIGGGIISNVLENEYHLREDYPSKKFDAGTPNIIGMIGLGEAARYVAKRIGLKKIHNHEMKLIQYLLEELPKINNLEFYGPRDITKKVGVITFNIKGWRSSDLTLALDDGWGILCRGGHHCALPAARWLGIEKEHGGSARISLHYFNTIDELDITLNALKELAQ